MCRGLQIAEENWVNVTSTGTCLYTGTPKPAGSVSNQQ